MPVSTNSVASAVKKLSTAADKNILTAILEQIRQIRILDLILASAVLLSTLVISQLILRLLTRRFDLAPIRRPLRLLSFLLSLLLFLTVLGDIPLFRILNSGVFFIIILICLKITDYILVEQYLIRRKKFHITRLPRDTIKGIIFTSLFLIMLRTFFGISLSGIGVTAAVATGVIGFALQDTLASVIAGISISIEKPFRLGDWIKVSGLEGKVEQINWRTTSIRTLTDDYVILPNFTISKTELINFSSPTKTHAREITIGVGYRHSPESVKKALLEAATGTEGILEKPQPVARLTQYGDFAISYTTKFWIQDYRFYPDIENSFRSKLWYIFKRQGITIPFPIRDVRIVDEKKKPQTAGHPGSSELKKIIIFEKNSAAELKIISKYLSARLYGAGETVFRTGTPGDYLYLIRRGSVSVRLPSGKPPWPVIRAGGIFGEMSMITGEERTATIITEEESEFLCLHRDDFKTVFKKHPGITRKIVSLIEKRQEQIRSEIKESDDPERRNNVPAQPKSLFRSLRKYLGL